MGRHDVAVESLNPLCAGDVLPAAPPGSVVSPEKLGGKARVSRIEVEHSRVDEEPGVGEALDLGGRRQERPESVALQDGGQPPR